MVQKVRTGVIHTETVTQAGECKVQINIQLDINLNEKEITAKTDDPESESVNWAIPDFTASPKLKFGKETK